MKMIRPIIICSFCLTFLSSVGQGGFKGKKNYVMYSNHIGYHSDLTYNLVFNDLYFDQQQLGKGYHFYFNHNIELHRIVSDRGELVIFYGFGSDSKPASPINILSSAYVGENNNVLSDNASRNRIGMKYRLYSRNGMLGLAPLHLYNEFGIASINSERDLNVLFENFSTGTNMEGRFKYKMKFVSISWGVGYQEILLDKFILGSGITVRYPLHLSTTSDYPDISDNNSLQANIGSAARRSFQFQELVVATVSIGYLF